MVSNIIKNKDLISAGLILVDQEAEEAEEYNEYLLEIENLLIHIKNPESFLYSKDENKSGYEELLMILPYLKNLKVFSIFGNMDMSFKCNSLVEELAKIDSLENIYFKSNINFDYDRLFDLIEKKDFNKHVRISKIFDSEKEMDYFGRMDKLNRKLFVSEYSNEDLKKLGKVLSSKKVPLNMYIKYKNYLIKDEKYSIKINNVSEINLNELIEIKKDPRIENIYINTIAESEGYYSLDEYYEIRKIIDDIISNIKIPNEDEPKRELIIFSQIYKMLGERISYDYYALEHKEDDNLSRDCRNLRNGILGVERDGKKQYLSVCAGYAAILLNVCSVIGIDCNYISTLPKKEEGSNTFVTDPHGHAYNAVTLDGQKYFCDLTWDSSATKNNNAILTNFLCSFDDFEKSHRNVGFSNFNSSFNTILNLKVVNQKGEIVEIKKEEYDKTLTIEEQMKLYSIEINIKQIDEMISSNYLAGFVSDYLSFVKQCKSKIEIKDYATLFYVIGEVENYIFTDEFKEKIRFGKVRSNIAIELEDLSGNIVKKDFSFYDTNDIEKIRSEVEEMRSKNGKYNR